MSPPVTTDIDALAAPAQDGQVLIWPGGDRLLALTDENRRRLQSYPAMLWDRPVADWRRVLPAAPIIMTGHQPSFFHAGVWAKSVVAADVARVLGGRADFLIVDSDVSHGIPLTWPEFANGYCRQAQALAAPQRQTHAFEQLEDTDGSAIQALLENPRLPGDATLSVFSAAFRSAPHASLGYTAQWIDGMKAVDRCADIAPMHFVRVSDLFSFNRDDAQRAAAFTAQLLRSARDFAAVYNAALADYRQHRGIRGTEHPIPDLLVEADRVEAPFWLLSPARLRERLFVTSDAAGRCTLSTAGGYHCTLGTQELQTYLPEALGERRIRPRALTLTLFARLLACDLFIHGVGGAKYDQITDGIIRRFFGIEPPAYACISATLRLPLPTFDVNEDDRWDCLHRLREIRFNPHRVGSPVASAEALIRREAAIAESARLRLHDPRNRSARRAVYEQIQSANADILSDGDSLVQTIRQRLNEATAKLDSNRIARSREWFFAFHSPARLNDLRDTLQRPI